MHNICVWCIGLSALSIDPALLPEFCPDIRPPPLGRGRARRCRAVGPGVLLPGRLLSVCLFLIFGPCSVSHLDYTAAGSQGVSTPILRVRVLFPALLPFTVPGVRIGAGR